MKRIILLSALLLSGCVNPDGSPSILTQAIANTLSQTYVESTTVYTPHGTYDVRGSCVGSSCISSVRRVR